MPIELIFSTSTSTGDYKNEGGQYPPWYGDVNNYNSWYSSPGAFDYLYYYNLVLSEERKRMFVQYGQNKQGWGAGRFFIQEMEIISEVENSDGSIDVTVRSRLEQFKQRKTSTVTQGYRANYVLKIYGNTVFNWSGNTMDQIDELGHEWYTKSFHVKPQETVYDSGLEFTVSYPDGENTGSSAFLGFGLHNPNSPSYKPMAIRKSGSWIDLDSISSSKINIRKGVNWIDKSQEDALTSRQVDKGKNRIRIVGNFRQLPKMNGGSST